MLFDFACVPIVFILYLGFLMDPFSKTTIEPIENIPLKTLIFWNCPFPFVQSILQSFHKTLKKLELDLPEDTLELLQRLDFPVLESVLVREDHFLIEDICKTFFKDKKVN